MVHAMLVFAIAFGTGALLRIGWLSPMVSGTGQTLFIESLLFILFLLILGWKYFTNFGITKPRFWIVVSFFAIVQVTLLAHQLDARFPFSLDAFVQDGATQTEEAGRLLLAGGNPYTADFQATRFGAFQSVLGPAIENAAWTHYVYPPANIVLSFPVIWFQDVGLHIDMSVVHLLALWILALMLVNMVRDWNHRLTIILLTIGNPLIWFFPLAGFNDTLFVLGIIAAVWFDWRNRPSWSGLSFGLAVAAKQTAWPLIPIWLVWLLFRRQRQKISAVSLRRHLVSVGIAAGTLFLPFVIWNGAALVDDLVRFPSGAIPNSFAFSGTTLLQYLHISGVVESAWSQFPSWAVQGIVYIVLGWFGIRRLKQSPTATNVLALSILVITALLLVNRFAFENHIQALFLLVIAAWVVQISELSPKTKLA